MKPSDETRLAELFDQFSPNPSPAFYQRPFPWKGSTMRHTYRRTLAAAAVLMLVTAAVIWSVPPLRSLAQDGFRDLFVRSDDDTLDLGPETGVTGSAAQMQAITDAEAAVGYDILEPSVLPDFVTFGGISVFPDNSVAIFYQDANGNSVLTINQTPATQPNPQGVGASAAIETLDISGVQAQYVRGVWMSMDGSTEAVWLPDVNLQTLGWWHNGMQFTVSADGEVVNLVRAITQDELIEIARSMIE